MSKHKYFFTILKKTNLLINSLLEKNLNKLNFLFYKNKLFGFTQLKRLIIFVFIILSLGLSYLSIPYLYNKDQINIKIKNQLLKKFNLNFTFSNNVDYNLLPWPNFTFQNVSISGKDQNFADFQKMKIYVSLKNLFLLKNIKTDNIFIEYGNFNLNKKNYNFFIDFLDNKFLETSFEIKNSNIFYRNIENDVLFINKINHMIYYYDSRELKNTLYTENEIFNIPYSLTLQNNINDKKIFSKINLTLLKLQIENEIEYSNNKKIGLINLIYNKNKSGANYQIDKETFILNFFDKSANQNFNYTAKLNFTPFYLSLSGKTNKLDLEKLLNINSFFAQIFKTEILNSKNLNINTNIIAKKILPYSDLINLDAKIKIEEGLIDFDNTKFSWLDYAKFQITDSLLYVNNNHLILDGKMSIDINNFNEIYQFLQTPRNHRLELRKIEFYFNYNFDQQIINFSDIKIDNYKNQEVNNTLNKFISKNNKIQNRIHFKNLMNKVFKVYAG